MNAFRHWHFAMTALVLTALVILCIRHVFSDETPWRQTIAQGVQQKISLGLEQIYWQWQNEGRPSEILYRPEHVKKAVKIPINQHGRPQFALSLDGCTEFLHWFVQDVALEQLLRVAVITEDRSQPLQCWPKTNNRHAVL